MTAEGGEARMQLSEWVISAGWTLGAALLGGLIGLAVDVTVVPWLRRSAAAHGWHLQDALATSLRGMPEVWGVLIGLTFSRPGRALFATETMVWLARIWALILVISLTVFSARLVSALIRTYVSGETSRGRSGSIFLNLTKAAIWALGFTFALGVLGVQIGPLVAALGVTGVAVSLGLQDTLANLFNGLQITLTKQIETGHYVRLQSGEEGEVVDINWRDTKLRTGSGDVVIVPNSVVGRTAMTNYTRGQEQHVSAIPFVVKPDVDLQRVVDIGLSVAREIQNSSAEAVDEFAPTCRVSEVTAEGATCTTRLKVVSYRERGILADEYLRALYARLRAEDLA